MFPFAVPADATREQVESMARVTLEVARTAREAHNAQVSVALGHQPVRTRVGRNTEPVDF